MNKISIYLLFFFAIQTTLIYSQDFSIGGGLTLGTETSINNDLSGKSAFGINARGLCKINNKWGVTSGFSYFFSQAPEPLQLTTYLFNFDGMYSFVKNDVIDFYGLVGFNIGYAEVKNKQNGLCADDTKIGLGLGLGLITKRGIFFEVKADGVYDQAQLTLGYLFKI
jgi:hypothetical protein